jgi:hypothetical protein
MVDEGGSQSKSENVPVENNRQKTDKRILIFFLLMFILFLLFTIVGITYSGDFNLGSIIPSFLGSMSFAIFSTGFLAYKYHRRRGIISTKKIFKLIAKISIIIGIGFAIGMFFLLTQTSILQDPPVEGDSLMMIAMFVGLFIGGILATLIGFIVILIVGFGMMGVMSALIRLKTADFLVEITKITTNITEETKKEDKKTYMGYIWLRWAFDIPDILDTKTLTINSGEPKKKIPWSIFKKAVMWQLFFGFVIVIYISFSPFLLDIMDMMSLFSIASNISTFIPLFILPWFIYLRLDAKIEGPVKDFKLYDGLSARMFQTLFAFSTLILIVRLALEKSEVQSVLLSFASFYIFFVIGVLIFTYIYFNYFENDLASDIAKKYEKLRK